MELLKEDLAWCLCRLPKNVSKLIEEKCSEMFIAGGFIRSCVANEKINDIDIFSNSKTMAELGARTILGKTDKLIQTDNAFTVCSKGKVSVQFIHKWIFDRPADVLPSFDFTIARAILWHDGKDWKSLCDNRFYADLAAKRLIYCSPKRIEEVGGSMLRVLKFYQRGYRIQLDSLGAVISRIITGIRVGEIEQKPDKEKEYALVIQGLLREVDPLIDFDHVAHLPSTKEQPDE